MTAPKTTVEWYIMLASLRDGVSALGDAFNVAMNAEYARGRAEALEEAARLVETGAVYEPQHAELLKFCGAAIRGLAVEGNR